ncbi:MAG: 1-acyl-sn-glycerol-3-phosphate acyltransferase [Desulfobacteraceae bacterium]|nr:MAG: 1-acyl-sn-glycerol-3-phosphate acyltransferase [Desulfobacteraceae bacterium]
MVYLFSKMFALWLLIGLYIGSCSCRFLLPRKIRARLLIRITSFYCRIALRILGIHLQVRRSNGIPTHSRTLYVCNHYSYLDILLIASVFPAHFISSREVEEMFFLGLMCKCGGSLFVERRNRQRISADIAAVSETIADGRPVLLFPEGTSSDGSSLLPFKVSLFAAVEQSDVQIVPLYLRYNRIDGQPFATQNHAKVCYYGDMTFFPHLKQLIAVRSVSATLSVLEPIPAVSYSRKEIAGMARAQMMQCFFDPIKT